MAPRQFIGLDGIVCEINDLEIEDLEVDFGYELDYCCNICYEILFDPDVVLGEFGIHEHLVVSAASIQHLRVGQNYFCSGCFLMLNLHLIDSQPVVIYPGTQDNLNNMVLQHHYYTTTFVVLNSDFIELL